MAGVILLALWAIAIATDYSTGLIRILVQAQPNRIKLMAGKILALAVFTLLAATVTALVVILLARPLARLEGIQVTAGRPTSSLTSPRGTSTSRSPCWSTGSSA